MSKEYYVKLSAKLDNSAKTVNELNKQITALESQVKQLEVKVNTSKINQSIGSFKSLDSALKAVGLSQKELEKNFTDIQVKTTSADKTITQYKNSLGQSVEVTKRLNGENATFSVQTTKLNMEMAKNINSASNLNKVYKTESEIFKSLNEDMSKYVQISKSMDTSGNITKLMSDQSGKIVTLTGKMVDGQEKYIGKLKEVNQAVDVNAKQADKWQYSWSKAFQSFTTYMSVSTVFYQAVYSIKSMITEVTDLDSSLLELRKVTDLEGESLERFTKRAYAVGAEVAKTGTEMIDAATQFAKAGYAEDQILSLGRVASMYTNIADEELSAGDAAEFIIAQLKAFNIEASNSEHIIDAVNEVSNNFAVSSADIANNLGKSSAVMANAGNTFEQMIGLMTAGTEVTRNASKVANGLKTITLRLQENLINPWYVQKCA